MNIPTKSVYRRKDEASYLFKYFLIANFLQYLEAGAVPALLLSLSDDFDMGHGQQGLLGGIVYIALSFGGPFAGYLLRSYDHRRVIGTAVLMNNLFTFLWALTPVKYSFSKGLFIVLRFMMGCAQCFLCVFLPLWINEFAPNDKRTSWMGYLQASVPLGVMCGYIIASVVIALSRGSSTCFHINCWRWPFLVEVALLLPFCIAFNFIPRQHLNLKVVKRKNKKSDKSTISNDNIIRQLNYNPLLINDASNTDTVNSTTADRGSHIIASLGRASPIQPAVYPTNNTNSPRQRLLDPAVSTVSYYESLKCDDHDDDDNHSKIAASAKAASCAERSEPFAYDGELEDYDPDQREDDDDDDDDDIDEQITFQTDQEAKEERYRRRQLRQQAISYSMYNATSSRDFLRRSSDELARLESADDLMTLISGANYENSRYQRRQRYSSSQDSSRHKYDEDVPLTVEFVDHVVSAFSDKSSLFEPASITVNVNAERPASLSSLPHAPSPGRPESYQKSLHSQHPMYRSYQHMNDSDPDRAADGQHEPQDHDMDSSKHSQMSRGSYDNYLCEDHRSEYIVLSEEPLKQHAFDLSFVSATESSSSPFILTSESTQLHTPPKYSTINTASTPLSQIDSPTRHQSADTKGERHGDKQISPMTPASLLSLRSSQSQSKSPRYAHAAPSPNSLKLFKYESLKDAARKLLNSQQQDPSLLFTGGTSNNNNNSNRQSFPNHFGNSHVSTSTLHSLHSIGENDSIERKDNAEQFMSTAAMSDAERHTWRDSPVPHDTRQSNALGIADAFTDTELGQMNLLQKISNVNVSSPLSTLQTRSSDTVACFHSLLHPSSDKLTELKSNIKGDNQLESRNGDSSSSYQFRDSVDSFPSMRSPPSNTPPRPPPYKYNAAADYNSKLLHGIFVPSSGIIPISIEVPHHTAAAAPSTQRSVSSAGSRRYRETTSRRYSRGSIMDTSSDSESVSDDDWERVGATPTSQYTLSHSTALTLDSGTATGMGTASDGLKRPVVTLLDESISDSRPVWSSIKSLLGCEVYRYLVAAMTALYFTVTGVQFWGTSYMLLALNAPSALCNVLFITIAATAPTCGVFFGGWCVDKCGGYKGARQRVVALELCSMFGTLGCVFALPITFLYNVYEVAILLWLLLFFGAAVLPACSGIVVSVVPRRNRPISSSLSLVVFNFFGYFLSLVLSGLLMQIFERNPACTGACPMIWGFRLVLFWSFWAILFLALALRASYRIVAERQRRKTEAWRSLQEDTDDITQQPMVSTSSSSAGLSGVASHV